MFVVLLYVNIVEMYEDLGCNPYCDFPICYHHNITFHSTITKLNHLSFNTFLQVILYYDIKTIFNFLTYHMNAESNGKLPCLFIPNKTATLIPEFAVEHLPWGRTAALVPEFAVKDLPLMTI